MHIVTRVGAALVLCAAAVTSAHAATLEFTLTGSRIASFMIDTDTPPDSTNHTAFGDQIFYEAVPGTYAGTPGNGEIIFGQGLLADFQIAGTPLGFTQFAGPELFSGVLDDPQFSLGTFNLRSIVSGNSTLTISDATPVPEPKAWLLLLGSIIMVGAIHARRQIPAC